MREREKGRKVGELMDWILVSLKQGVGREGEGHPAAGPGSGPKAHPQGCQSTVCATPGVSQNYPHPQACSMALTVWSHRPGCHCGPRAQVLPGDLC